MAEQKIGSNLVGINVGRGRGRRVGNLATVGGQLYIHGGAIVLYENPPKRINVINGQIATYGGMIQTTK